MISTRRIKQERASIDKNKTYQKVRARNDKYLTYQIGKRME